TVAASKRRAHGPDKTLGAHDRVLASRPQTRSRGLRLRNRASRLFDLFAAPRVGVLQASASFNR
ncbi:MAG: hypothetical protein AAFW46_08000, partial [Pseudomonadota bacterium]